ncbi:hypothetical protein DEO72_LG5g3362 [Vigna unguiculata]|uniref:Uncharacterized protein n=1 Tax=Vigna unguiculata TaxID=3917 RepID=A0A4D6M1X7_VIGUN|nr:hypothetical protein DEO72_LG5g3362 [Vigna unguiculata]
MFFLLTAVKLTRWRRSPSAASHSHGSDVTGVEHVGGHVPEGHSMTLDVGLTYCEGLELEDQNPLDS